MKNQYNCLCSTKDIISKEDLSEVDPAVYTRIPVFFKM